MLDSFSKFGAAFALGTMLVATEFAAAGEIKSEDFSIGFGATPLDFFEGDGMSWTRKETEDTNSGPGDNFDLDVQLTGGAMSPSGPTFRERVLGPVSGGDMCGLASKFVTIVTGQYTGPIPTDAANPPNYRLQVNIAAISIYAVVVPGEMDLDPSYPLNFTETTTDQEQSQDAVEIDVGPESLRNVSNYMQISWAPKNLPTDSGALDQEQGRVFLLEESQPDLFAIDGFEITGHIVLLYDSKPQ